MNIERYNNIINVTHAFKESKAVPLCSIKNQDNKYWNGFSWVYDNTFLKMELILDDIYFYNIAANDSSSLKISIINPFTHEEIESEEVNLEENNVVDDVIVGSSYTFKVKTDTADDVLLVKKVNDVVEFTTTMMKLPGNISVYVLTFDELNSYSIELVQNDVILKTYILTVKDFTPGLYKKYVSQETIRQNDGSDTRVLDERERYLYGVKVFAKNKDTNEEFDTTTNERGEWGMEVTNGNYIFLFDSDNYNQVSLERSVL